MKVFLTGASGVLGRYVTRALAAEGHEVVGLVRTERGAEVVREAGATARFGGLFDLGDLTRAVEGSDAVVNFASHMPTGRLKSFSAAWRANDRLRMHGATVVARAVGDAGVPRLVQPSLSAMYADGGDDWVDEHSPISLSRATEPFVVSETAVERAAQVGVEGVILRFGTVTGPEPMTRWLVRRARSGRPTGFGDPASWTHVVHPEDVGTAVAAALTAPADIYNVGAEPLRRAELAEALAIAGGRRGGRFHGPAMTRLGGQRLEMFMRSQRVSSQRFGDRTGWHPMHPKLTQDWFDGVV
ncbi:MAG: NAD(P)-dependent oxidoreductase [Aeromicrobium erythreum]